MRSLCRYRTLDSKWTRPARREKVTAVMEQATGSGDEILDDLVARGLVQDHTDLDLLRARLADGPITLYAGFDPSAESLHVGNLVPLLLLRRFQLFGHRSIALAGGATGMIGDPGGRSTERNLLDAATLDRNVAAIKSQLERFLDFSPGPTQARLVDNRDWTEPMGVLDFLRDVGKHVTVNAMLAKESVRARVESEHGISYTEFSYMLLQANDYHWLYEHEHCELQVGGSDQWGNITAGVDLVRRRAGTHLHAFTVPLVTKADGSKFGKSAGGAVWLDAELTTPYELYQHFVQTDDRDVERFLLQLTLLPVEAVRSIVEEHATAPERRHAQQVLAREMTALVHGEQHAAEAERASADFTRRADERSSDDLEALVDEIPTTRASRTQLDEGFDLVELLVEVGAASSKGDARRALEQRGVYLNDAQQAATRPVTAADLLHDRFLVLRRGKKQRYLVVVDD
jgi:tyrosyl-tRNA synthetase